MDTEEPGQNNSSVEAMLDRVKAAALDVEFFLRVRPSSLNCRY